MASQMGVAGSGPLADLSKGVSNMASMLNAEVGLQCCGHRFNMILHVTWKLLNTGVGELLEG